MRITRNDIIMGVHRQQIDTNTSLSPEQYYTLRCDAVESCRTSRTFRRLVLPRSSMVRILLFACLTHYSTLNMDTAYTSEISLKLYQSTRRHSPEDSTGLVTALSTSAPACPRMFLLPYEIQRTGLQGLAEVTGGGYRRPVSGFESPSRHV